MEIDLFKKLLAEGKEDEAQELLEQFLASAVSPSEEGSAILAMVSAHMEAHNTLNKEYLKILKNAAAEIAGLTKQENGITDAINLVKARKQISGSKPQKPIY